MNALFSVKWISALGTVSLLLGCVATTPVFDEVHGQSVRALHAQQTLKPEASMTNRSRVPEGMDGRAARETLERYHRSFQQPQRQGNPFVIGVGTGDSRND
jgi:hypothetical protein